MPLKSEGQSWVVMGRSHLLWGPGLGVGDTPLPPAPAPLQAPTHPWRGGLQSSRISAEVGQSRHILESRAGSGSRGSLCVFFKVTQLGVFC